MSFSFYFIFSIKLEKAQAYGWEIHIHIRKHHEGWLFLMRTCVMDLLLCKEKRKEKSNSSSQNHPWFSPEPLIRGCYIHVRLNQSCIPGLKELTFSNLSTHIDMIILTLLCALLVFLSTGAIQLHCLDCSEVHHHVSLEERLPRAVSLGQHFYNWKML